MALFGFEPWVVILLVLSISGILSFGLTQLFKMLYNDYLVHTPENDKEVWWWNSFLRLIAVMFGVGIGSLFILAGADPIVTIAVGACGGILNTSIVKIVKARLTTFKLPADDDDNDDDSAHAEYVVKNRGRGYDDDNA